MICFVDHFDSFSFNVLAWLMAGAGSTAVHRIPVDDVAAMRKLRSGEFPVVFSPGPGSPMEATESLDLCRAIAGRAPVLGICLGHQILGVVAGWEVVRAAQPFHGTRRSIIPDASSFFFGDLPDFKAATYNSLALRAPPNVGKASFPVRVTATCEFGDVQAIESVTGIKAVGVQFHPESFLSDDISGFRDKWLAYATAWMKARDQSSATAPLLMPS